MPQVVLLSCSLMKMIIMVTRVSPKDIFKESDWQRENNLGRKRRYSIKTIFFRCKGGRAALLMKNTGFNFYINTSDIAKEVSNQKR